MASDELVTSDRALRDSSSSIFFVAPALEYKYLES